MSHAEESRMSGRSVEMPPEIGLVRMAGADCPPKIGEKMAAGSNATSSHPTKHARLLAAARRLFAQKGYEGATVREIAALAGVTKPVLYYYFGNKEGIYFELIREPSAKLDALLNDFRQGEGSAKARLEQLCDHLFYLFTEHLELLNLIQGLPLGSPYYDIEAGYRKLQKAIERLIKEGIEQKEFQNANTEAGVSAIIGILYMATQEWLKGRKMGIPKKNFRGFSASSSMELHDRSESKAWANMNRRFSNPMIDCRNRAEPGSPPGHCLRG